MDHAAFEDARPLDFLAQIIDTGLPESGLLLFFADTLNCAGLAPSDREGFRVVWTEDEVQPRALPEGNEHFACGRVALCVETSIPGIGDPRLPEVDVGRRREALLHDPPRRAIAAGHREHLVRLSELTTRA